MIAKKFEDLVVWQLSVELRDDIVRLTEHGRVARDFKFRTQIRESARSAPRNTAEGFGHFNPKPFARYMRIALGSLNETRNHLKEGLDLKYFTESDANRLLKLCRRASIAATRLIRYLDSCEGVAPTGWNAY